MKKIILLLISVFTLSSIYAQDIEFGICGGINSSTLDMEDFIIDNQGGTGSQYMVSALSSRTGFHFGAVAEISMLSFYAQPELLFTSLGGDVEITENGSTSIENITINRLDLPIMVGRKLGPLRLGVGPVASYILKAESVFEEVTNVTPETLKKASWGVQAGVGISLGRLAIDAKYEFGLSKLGDGVTVGGQAYNFDSRTKQWIFSLAFYF